MSTNAFTPKPDQLPTALPLFPLSGVLLLPGGQLPLNIFEPRYLQMTTDCFQLGRMIGIIQPKEPKLDPVPTDQGLYEVGCAGRVTSFDETPDGRFIIALTGVCRFRLDEEIDTVKPYRMGAVDFRPYFDDLERPEEDKSLDRQLLLDSCSGYFQSQGIDADLGGVSEVGDDTLVTSIAMACPFPGPEKQALLECQNLSERFDMLVSLMRLSVNDNSGSAGKTIN